jgi:hypothetical protein
VCMCVLFFVAHLHLCSTHTHTHIQHTTDTHITHTDPHLSLYGSPRLFIAPISRGHPQTKVAKANASKEQLNKVTFCSHMINHNLHLHCSGTCVCFVFLPMESLLSLSLARFFFSLSTTAPLSSVHISLSPHRAYMQQRHCIALTSGAREPQLVMNYLVVEGYKDAAAVFEEESGVHPNTPLESVASRMKVRLALQQGDITRAMEVGAHFPSPFLLHLHLCRALSQLSVFSHILLVSAVSSLNKHCFFSRDFPCPAYFSEVLHVSCNDHDLAAFPVASNKIAIIITVTAPLPPPPSPPFYRCQRFSPPSSRRPAAAATVVCVTDSCGRGRGRLCPPSHHTRHHHVDPLPLPLSFVSRTLAAVTVAASALPLTTRCPSLVR